MNWNSNASSDSDNEMFQMTSSRMQEDNSRVRLLSVSGDEDIHRESLSMNTTGLPQLQFRQHNDTLIKAQEERKYKLAIISIMVVGVALTIIINVGMGIKLRNMDDYKNQIVMSTCPKEKVNVDKKCDESFPWQNYRLPNDVYPEFYSIFLHPNLTHGSFSGVVNIMIQVRQSTSLIVLHTKNIKLNKVQVFEGMYDQLHTDREINQKSPFIICKEFDFVAISLAKSLTAGKKYTVHFEFSAELAMSLDGFYLSRYKTKTGINKTLATTQFESISARAAFPCFDEPSFKANFSLSIVRDPNYMTLSNMPVEITSDYDDNLKLDKFQTSVSMSTYLVAFIISDFSNITKIIPLKQGSIPVSVYAPSDKINTAKFALEVACKVLTLYEGVFKVPYPLPKLDLVAIPDFQAGAMENWGLVTYRETAILWDENTSSVNDKEWVAIVIAHELAHQWFGNLVTMNWWNDLWLNEGFASFVEFFGVDKIYPEWNIMNDFNNKETTGAMHIDESEYTHPISVTIENSEQIGEVFDSISYSKGACIISMVISYLGEEAFFNGVGDYLQKFSYKNTINKDLVNAVSLKASSQQQQSNVMKMLDSWTTEPGFPILNVSLSGNAVLVSQTRYLLSTPHEYDPRCYNKSKKSIWQIPLSHMTDLSKNISWNFMDEQETKFFVLGNPNWIILNVNRGGYYLINYDAKLLTSLSTQLKRNHTAISEIDRSGILFNIAKSAKAGFVGYDSLLDVLTYLKNEEAYGPINTAVIIITSIEFNLRMQFYTETHKKFKEFSNRLFIKLYEKLGWPSNDNSTYRNSSHSSIKLRHLIVSLSCSYGNEHCTKQAIERFKQWKNNDSQIMSDYKTTVYNTAIRLGSADDWDYMWKKYLTDFSLDATEKRKLLIALCHIKVEDKISFLLDESLSGENIHHQDIGTVLLLLTNSRAGCALVWKFLRTRWDSISRIITVSTNSMRRIISGVFSAFIDESEIAGARTFLDMKNLTHIRYMKRALDQAQLNVQWIKLYQPQIVNWLNENFDQL